MMVQLVNLMVFTIKEPEVYLRTHPHVSCPAPDRHHAFNSER